MTDSLPYLSQQDIARYLPYQDLISALQLAFKQDIKNPLRHHHYWGKRDDELLIMPAWHDKSLCVKLVNLCPDNRAKGLIANSGVVVLFDGDNGYPLAVFDAGELTARRTAAASALASSFLSRQDANSLLLVGTGRLFSYLVEAHAAVRDIKKLYIWARSSEKTKQAISSLSAELQNKLEITAVTNMEQAVQQADIISTATRSIEPIVYGQWLQPGTHLDLVGGYRPDMCEVDAQTVLKATVVADTMEGVLAEAGDIIQPIEAGVIDSKHVVAELHDLCSAKYSGRKNNEEITLFKSVGTALEDLAAATVAYQNINE